MGATSMQAIVRGYVARERVDKLLGELYRAGGGNPVLRKRYFAKGLKAVSERAEQIISTSEARISALMAAASDAVRFSRHVFGGPPPAAAAATVVVAVAS